MHLTLFAHHAYGPMVYTPACTTLNQNVRMKREKEEKVKKQKQNKTNNNKKQEEEEGNKEEQEEEEEEEEKSAVIFLSTSCTQKRPLRHLDQPVREHEIM